MKKIKEPQHYYFSTAEMITTRYYKMGKRVKMPSSFSMKSREDPIYQAVIDCIQRAQASGLQPIYIPRVACATFFEVYKAE